MRQADRIRVYHVLPAKAWQGVGETTGAVRLSGGGIVDRGRYALYELFNSCRTTRGEWRASECYKWPNLGAV